MKTQREEERAGVLVPKFCYIKIDSTKYIKKLNHSYFFLIQETGLPPCQCCLNTAVHHWIGWNTKQRRRELTWSCNRTAPIISWLIIKPTVWTTNHRLPTHHCYHTHWDTCYQSSLQWTADGTCTVSANCQQEGKTAPASNSVTSVAQCIKKTDINFI